MRLGHYEVVMDVTLANRTSERLEGVALELATTSNLQLMDNPEARSLEPNESARIRVSIKVCAQYPVASLRRIGSNSQLCNGATCSEHGYDLLCN